MVHMKLAACANVIPGIQSIYRWKGKVAKAQEALAKADDLESEFHAQGQLATVAKMQAKANRIERTATGLRTSWDCEVHDYTAFAKWAWENRRDDCHEFFSSLAFKVVRELKRDLPGMKAIERKKAV